MPEDRLRITPLGGLGEIGRNMLLVEHGASIIVIDAGLMFPENDMLGIDIVIPDLTYVFERADRVKAIIITHGHEDHIGALPYLLEKVQAPIYATRLTRGLVEVKLGESRIRRADLHTIDPSDVLSIPPFRLEFFRVSHSIPDGVGLGIQTPVGLVVHSGDFKFDHSPVDGQRTDFAKLAELGARGVLLLLSDSTNSENPGYTPSEQVLGETLSHVFAGAGGRVIVATFASNISRVQQVMDTAQRYGRRVAVAGRSMSNNVRIARQLGYLNVSDSTLLSVDHMHQLPDNQITLVCTGSQGEPTSALVRMGQERFHSISIVPGDTVIVSATPIPGNEEYINRTLDDLFRLGANVFYDEVLDVHVSGHASQEEQKMMINLIKPKYFVPIHGEYRHLVLHSKLAQQCGVDPKDIFVMETGSVLEIGRNGAELVDNVSSAQIFVDGRGVGDVGRTVIEERQVLARNGFLVAVVTLDKYTGALRGQPSLVTRGFVYDAESGDLLDRLKEEINRIVETGGGQPGVAEALENSLAHLAFEETGRRPMVIPVVKRV